MIVLEKDIPIPVRAPRSSLSSLQIKAYCAVRNARRNGTLLPQPCEKCGAKRVHAHHDDYTKPLKVRWLCPLHHRRHHISLLKESGAGMRRYNSLTYRLEAEANRKAA